MGGRINFTTHWGGKKPKQQNTHREALQATETEHSNRQLHGTSPS